MIDYLHEGNLRKRTKFVECPVVDKVPFLSDVLYTGQLQSLVSLISSAFVGLNKIIGTEMEVLSLELACLDGASYRYQKELCFQLRKGFLLFYPISLLPRTSQCNKHRPRAHQTLTNIAMGDLTADHLDLFIKRVISLAKSIEII